jgi:prevent-host-death family protein
MSTVASWDLQNHTLEILRQVSAGTTVTITVHGTAVAEIRPVRATRNQFLTKADLISLISARQADPGLADDLERLAGETTDDLDPL